MYHRMHSVLTHRINTLVGSLLLASVLLLSLSFLVRAREEGAEYLAAAKRHIPPEVRLVPEEEE